MLIAGTQAKGYIGAELEFIPGAILGEPRELGGRNIACVDDGGDQGLRIPISIEKEGLDKTLGEAVCETEQEKRQRKASERNLEELGRS